ncbi:hypothetical protein [Nocardioides sp. P5_C9_2]
MRVRRGDLVDVFVADGRAAVFVAGQVVVLSEMATVILEATPTVGSTTLEQLTATVVAEFGPPEPPDQARGLILDHVEDLTSHAILEWDPAAGRPA